MTQEEDTLSCCGGPMLGDVPIHRMGCNAPADMSKEKDTAALVREGTDTALYCRANGLVETAALLERLASEVSRLSSEVERLKRERDELSGMNRFHTDQIVQKDKALQQERGMEFYRKKPIVIEAERYDRGRPAPKGVCQDSKENCLDQDHVHTLNGPVKVAHGDYIIRGIEGESYPCAATVFESTYERLGEKETIPS